MACRLLTYCAPIRGNDLQMPEEGRQCIKGGFSHGLRARFAGEVWQAGFHEHRIRGEEDFQCQLGYIAANAERRGLVGHAFLHTLYFERLDPMPIRLRAFDAAASGVRG